MKRSVKILSLAAILFLILTHHGYAKNAGDLLEQYLKGKVIKGEVLALVEIVSVKDDARPEKGAKRTGTITLRTIESGGTPLPKHFSVRFWKRHAEGEDAWTWDYVKLEKGHRLLGFFNSWDRTRWEVRLDGRTNVINNLEQIDEELLRRAQPRFKTTLLKRRPVD